jgi:hypothetical protein
MTESTGDSALSQIEQRIAKDQMEYLREHSDVCAEGNVVGLMWVRYHDDEWQAVKYGGKHRLHDRVKGVALEIEDALRWFIENPVTIRPSVEAAAWSQPDGIWGDVEDQDVFTNAERCFWCGKSEHSVSLGEYRTAEQGVCDFCPDCLESWERAGEIVEMLEAQ